ncbi:MAG: hypothetical protein WD042_11235 [Phycisphaeraceae bacterium]
MQQFCTRHQDQMIGMLNGFDRLRFRGTLRWLATCRGLDRNGIGVCTVMTENLRTSARFIRLHAIKDEKAKAADGPAEQKPDGIANKVWIFTDELVVDQAT